MNQAIKIKKQTGLLRLLPIIIFSSVVPLITYAKYTLLSTFISSHWLGQPVSADVFSYYKMILIIICGISTLVLMINKLIKADLKFKLSVPLLIAVTYGILVLLSTILSDYTSVALWGAPERYEGGIVLISYMIVFIYTFSILDNIKSIKTIIGCMLISASIIFTISALQFFGLDIFRTDFFRAIFNMKASPTNPYDLILYVKEYVSYGTLYNSNHFSLYIGLLFPITLAFFSTQKQVSKIITALLLVFSCVLAFIGSNVSGGYFAAAVSIILLLFLAFPYIIRNIKNVIILSLSVLCLLVAVNFLSDGRVAKNLRISSITNEDDQAEIEGEKIFINDIVLGSREISIDTDQYDFTVLNENNSIRVFDGTGIELETILSFGEKPDAIFKYIYHFSDKKYRNYTVKTNGDYSIVTVFAGSKVMYFHMTDTGVKVPGLNNSLDIIRDVDRNPFLYKMPQLFSGRGYIWSGMLPLLKDTVLIGNGPDTTFLTYPQFDYIGKVNMRATFNVVIEKPHCYYLQLAHDTGWLSLILLLVLFVYFVIDTLIVLIKYKPRSFHRKYSIAIFCGVIAYLIASIIYDSSVLTAPVFWIVLAVGFALNRITRANDSTSLEK